LAVAVYRDDGRAYTGNRDRGGHGAAVLVVAVAVTADLMDAIGLAVMVIAGVVLVFILWWRNGPHKGEPSK
jgi:hypothetical protein